MPVKFLTLLTLSLHAFFASAQSFYDINQVQEIKLTFFQTNWDAKLDSLKSVNEEAYLLAKSVEINGEIFDSVGVKYKGNSTYSPNNAKNPMHIELDYVRPDQNYKGLKDIKLGNAYFDATFIREALAYEILQKYMAAPKANFARLYIGGSYYGVYSNQQSINKSFAREHFGTTGQNPFFKCNPQSVGGPGGGSGGYPDLVYSSADSAAYYKKYERKSDYGWRQLLNLMDTLRNHPNSAHQVADIDRALWMHAFNAVTVNLDSYTGAFGQNYYLYMDDNGRFMPIVWDLNMCFGSFTNLPTGNLSVAQMQNLDPLTQATTASRPLISKLLSNPTYKRMYLAHIRTLFQENFADTKYRERALQMQAIIAADVQADTKKFYSNAQFTSNIDNQLSGGGFTNPPGVTQLMNARYNYLKNNANFTAVAPTLAAPAFSPTAPAAGEIVQATASVQNANKVWIGTRSAPGDVFQRSEMFDDGLHNDGTAGDGTYGGTFTAGAVKTQIYLYAENTTSGRFLPERAEYEFINLPSSLPLPNLGDVVINEILASNTNGAKDENGQYEDWVELYNKTAQAQSLFGLYLTDKADNPDKWEFPNGTFIPASGFLIVWADEDSSQGPLHTNFKLSASGEFVMLSNGANVVYDSISFGQQQPDISFGRFPNGTGGFVTMPTTFGKTNSLTNGTGEVEAEAFSLRVFPNPTTSELVLRSDDSELHDVAVYDASGRLLHRQTFDFPSAEHRIAVADWPDGLYFVRVNGTTAVTFLKL